MFKYFNLYSLAVLHTILFTGREKKAFGWFQIAFFNYILKKHSIYVFTFGIQRNVWLRGSKCENMHLCSVYLPFITKTIQLLIKDKMFFRKRKIVSPNIFLQFVFV